YEPEAIARWVLTPVRGGRYHLRHAVLSVGPETLHAVSLFPPILWKRFDLAGEGIIRVAVAGGGQVARKVPLLVVKRRVINVSGQKVGSVGIFRLRDDVDLVAAFPAEPRWIKTVAGGVRVFELTFEQDPSGLLGQGGVNLARAGDKPMQ